MQSTIYDFINNKRLPGEIKQKLNELLHVISPTVMTYLNQMVVRKINKNG